ncbi:hypothetical protein TH4_10695 [Thalassospira tepidiphila MCCC 1A03514]|uniref:Uncharacterized protein n=1 Tax=Thalassospira tepidiphila MCCC 1A03514 TaxID=1177930 RepID=A0A853KYF1_9PROT|nr:hypothetical protein TH4_10695 [Thalassospira tepidiphila MCCC 1A03514]
MAISRPVAGQYRQSAKGFKADGAGRSGVSDQNKKPASAWDTDRLLKPVRQVGRLMTVNEGGRYLGR